MAVLKELLVYGASKHIGDSFFNDIKSGVWKGTEIGIAYGGTGATTAAGARANLSVPYMTTDSYPTLMPTNGSNNWIKIGTSNSSYGLLPSTSGGSGNGHNYIGTSSWYWKYAYIDEIYGSLKGNADTGTKLKTPRTITIGNTGKSFDGSGDVSWTLEEIGVSSSSHNHDGRYIRWGGSTADVSAMAWGTLTTANGYTILAHTSSSDGGDWGMVNKSGQIFMQLDGYYYQNEGAYRVTDVSETVTGLGTSGTYVTWTKNGTTNNITVPYAVDADTVDGYHSNSFYQGYLQNPFYISKYTDHDANYGWHRAISISLIAQAYGGMSIRGEIWYEPSDNKNVEIIKFPFCIVFNVNGNIDNDPVIYLTRRCKDSFNFLRVIRTSAFNYEVHIKASDTSRWPEVTLVYQVQRSSTSQVFTNINPSDYTLGTATATWTKDNASILTEDYANYAADADTLDGQHGSYYAAASSLANYLPLVGGTMSGAINFSNTNAKLAFGSLSTSPITGYAAPSLGSQGVGIYSRYNGSSDEGALIITEDTCVIYNSADTGWNFQVHDKDISTAMGTEANGTRTFGIDQEHYAWSLAGFKKKDSSNDYVLLGGGSHKALTGFALNDGTNASGTWGINITGNAGTATKLQTARNIWGQSFDGSGNVDGTLYINGTYGSYTEGIRIKPSSAGWTTILLGGTDLTASSGTSAKSWSLHTYEGNFYLNKNNANGRTVNRIYGHLNGFTIGNTDNTSNALSVGGTVYATSDMVAEGDIRAKGNDMYVGASSGSQCHQQYDSATQSLKFIFD